MNIKVSSTEKGNNKGSCQQLVDYLNKENEKKDIDTYRHFFSHTEDMVTSYEVQSAIDSNHRKLSKKDSKFFMLTISPSELELWHIKCSEKALRDYTREVMNAYAANFNKGLKGEDLVWFGKIEEYRIDKKTKVPKPGLQWHVHVVVSRRDNQQFHKLSPQSNHRNTTMGAVKGGFDRNVLREQSEEVFDKLFRYERAWKDSFLYQNTLKNGSTKEKDRITTITAAHNPSTSRSGAILFGKLSAAMAKLSAEADYEEAKRKRWRERGEDDEVTMGM
ncbi:DUF5712 family protein [Imperialibacter roseus]|uniref:DUF5712 family protein n=1 Tax=Imperialibacter roseus TaxID=1324217 RepID=A0ABZ0IQ62_9BACT|nr:DUF5712 family protein [Imperialibacter roseus]WOK07187.1 DUF5712 family protein [Imperialibacter roseus]